MELSLENLTHVYLLSTDVTDGDIDYWSLVSALLVHLNNMGFLFSSQAHLLIGAIADIFRCACSSCAT